MSTPATLPNLALWLDGGQVAYSDAGVTISASPFGRVQQIAQPAPLTGSWTASGSSRPWRELTSIDFHANDPSLLLPPAPALPVPANNFTVGLAWQARGGTANMPLMYASHSAGSPVGVMEAFGYLLQDATGSQYNPAGLPGLAAGHLIAQCTLIIVCSSTGYAFTLTVNGTQYTAAVSLTPTPGTLSNFQLGRWTGYANSSMCVSQYVVCAQALGSTDRGALQAYLLSKPADDPPVTAPLVAMLGDSVGAGWAPSYQTALNGVANPPRVINCAVPGTHTTDPAQIPSYYTTDVLPHYSASRARNIIVCEGISINDVAGLTGGGVLPAPAAATVLAAYYGILDRARSDGFIVVACTLSPTTQGANYEAARAIINADIRANYLTHAHYLADVGAAPNMSTPTDAANTTYFTDGTHLTTVGYGVWDTVLAPVLQLALVPPSTALDQAALARDKSIGLYGWLH